MENYRESFRQALIFLKKFSGRTLAEIAKAGDCTTRHIQGVLSDKERKGLGVSAGHRVADLFGLSYEDMLTLGKMIREGQDGFDILNKLKMIDAFKQGRITGKSVNIPWDEGKQLTISDEKPDQLNVIPLYSHYPSRMVPLISWVQAGDFVDPQAQTTPGYAETWVETSATNSGNAFALVVSGDSMEPEFRDGDIITVDPDRAPVSGNFVVVKNGHEATFKQLVNDGSSVFLKPLNDRYPILDMTGIEFRIVGVVVEKRKVY